METEINRIDRRSAGKLGNTIIAMFELLKAKTRKHIGTFVKDAIIIEGFVEITNGSTHIRAKNSIVNQGLINIVNLFSCQTVSAATSVPSYGWKVQTSDASMRIGSDTATATVGATTTLTVPIGAGLGTAPNTQSMQATNPSAGVYRVIYTATWNPNTVSGTLGELGLFLHQVIALQTPQIALPAPASNTLFSRLASADAKFTSFTINEAVALSVSWTLQFSFAV